LGAIATDGCVFIKDGTYQISLTSKDKDWLIIINNLICPEKPLRKSKRDNCYTITIYSKKLALWLVANGIIPRKSLSLELPNIPEKYLPDFIRGCMDGDGSIYQRKLKTGKLIPISYLCSSSLSFVNSVCEVFSSKGINYCFLKRKREEPRELKGVMIINKNDRYRIQMSKHASLKLFDWIYYPGFRIAMPRKLGIVNKIIEYPKYFIKN
jgi:hypothetical protein